MQRLGIYDTLGYRNYQNSRDLAAVIKTIRDTEPVLRDFSTDKNQQIYVTRTRYKSDYAIRISARLTKSGLGCRSFDPTQQPRVPALNAISQIDRKSAGKGK